MVFLYGHRDDPARWEEGMQKRGPLQNTLAVATLVLPLLALLLDLKHLECAIQARAISRFIRQAFRDEPEVREWEVYNWGDGERADDRLLAWLRTLVSASVAGLPTLALAYFALAVIAWQFSIPWVATGVGVAATIAAGVGSWRAWRLLWPGGFHPLWGEGWRRLLGLSTREEVGSEGKVVRRAPPTGGPAEPS